MEIFYFNHYAVPPGFGNVGRPHNLARSMADVGHDMTIFSASEHHLRIKPAPREEHSTIHLYDGIRYFQIPTRSYSGNGIGRLLNMLDYSRGIKQLILDIENKLLKTPDVIIASSPHLLFFPAISRLAKKLHVKIIFEVRDIWPLSLVEIAGISSWHPLVLWMGRIEKLAYKNAEAVVSLLPKAFAHMAKRGLSLSRFHYIPNGIALDEWDGVRIPLPKEHQSIFRQLRSKGKLIVVYAGSHGIPNALDQILDLSKINKNINCPYHFVLIGDGIEKQKLIQRVENDGISFVTFLPKVSKGQIITALKESDICFIGWKKYDIYKYGISPNKIGDYFMSAKPIIHAVNAGNDPVKDANAGISINPYDAEQLEAALKTYTNLSIEHRNSIGTNGLNYALKTLDWKVLGKAYADICEKIVGNTY